MFPAFLIIFPIPQPVNEEIPNRESPYKARRLKLFIKRVFQQSKLDAKIPSKCDQSINFSTK
jgi:hypothetical protein